MIKGPKEASLVVSFRSHKSAADAVELGRGNSNSWLGVWNEVKTSEV